MSTKPRAFCLFTGKRGIVFPNHEYKDELLQNIKENEVDYVITGDTDFWEYIKMQIPSDTTHFKKIYDNSHHQIYKVQNL